MCMAFIASKSSQRHIHETVVGNPGRTVVLDGKRVDERDVEHPDIEHTRLPDPVAEALDCLVRRVSELESELADLRAGRTPAPRPVAEDGDCLPGVRDEIDAILNLSRDATQ